MALNLSAGNLAVYSQHSIYIFYYWHFMSSPQPIMCSIFTHYAFEQCSNPLAMFNKL